jgi:hypothetical protein
MKHANVILLIFNCEKYKYKAIKQKETWLKDVTFMPFFHVIGNPQLTKEYILDETEQILYVKVEDDYNSLPKKVISAYNAIQNEYTFHYIYKTDDDQYLTQISFLHTITNLLLSKIPKIHYAGQIIHVENPYVSQYCEIHPELPKDLIVHATKYCSGRFYILSDLAVQQLVSKRTFINNEYLEDYAIGYYLDPILKQNMLNIQTNKYFQETFP